MPKSFVLRRNKARPLLVQFNITFLVVKMLGGGGGGGGDEPSAQSAFDQGNAAMADASDAMGGMLA